MCKASIQASNSTGYDGVRIPKDVARDIRQDCFDEAQELLGEGYVPDYYQQAAGGFVGIAEAWYARGVAAGRAER